MAEVERQSNVLNHVSENDVAANGKWARTGPISHKRVPSLTASDRFIINMDKLLGKGSYSYFFSFLRSEGNLLSLVEITQKDTPCPREYSPSFRHPLNFRVIPYCFISFVYDAKDIGGLRVVAKVTPLAEKTHIKCYRNEIAAFQRLGKGHKNIVKFYNEFIQDKCGVLILERLSSYTLEDYITEHGRLDLLTALNYFDQILSAVELMHKLHISPRDLKAENIAFDSTGKHVKLFDLGLAVIIEPNENGEIPPLKSTTGSPLYMAPEVLAVKPHNSFTHDIWCLGQILYMMLVGHCPFYSCTTLEDLKEEVLVFRSIAYPSWLDYKTTQLLRGMLEWDPALRMSLDEIRNSVDDLISSESVF